MQGGLSTASESNVETDLFGAGIRAERAFAAGEFDGLYAGTAVYSRVSYHGDSLPDDDFLRLRNSLEFKRYAGFSLGDHPIEYGLFATIDVFADPPTGPTTGIDVPRTQLETGVVFGARPEWRVWKIPLPRVGLSYRFAGDVSAVRVRPRGAVLELGIQAAAPSPARPGISARPRLRASRRRCRLPSLQRSLPCSSVTAQARSPDDSWSKIASSWVATVGSSTNTPCSQLSDVDRGSRL